MKKYWWKLSISVALVALGACTGPKHPYPALRPGEYDGHFKVGKPYAIEGNWYYPEEVTNYDEEGVASWYGPSFHGKDTANGEMFHQESLTAAHRTLPMPSMVRVTNLENDRTIVLLVNDRGPYSKGRIIDVSKRAAELLGFREKGTTKVRVQFLPGHTRMLLSKLHIGQNSKLMASAPPPIEKEISSQDVVSPLPLLVSSALAKEPEVTEEQLKTAMNQIVPPTTGGWQAARGAVPQTSTIEVSAPTSPTGKEPLFYPNDIFLRGGNESQAQSSDSLENEYAARMEEQFAPASGGSYKQEKVEVLSLPTPVATSVSTSQGSWQKASDSYAKTEQIALNDTPSTGLPYSVDHSTKAQYNTGKNSVQAQEIAPQPVMQQPTETAIAPAVSETPKPQTSSYAKSSKVEITKTDPVYMPGEKFYVQAGAFGIKQNADKMANKLLAFGKTRILPSQGRHGTLYKVQVGPFNSKEQASTIVSELGSSGHQGAQIVKEK